MNDFAEFAQQFRRRTAARMLEFEASLDKVQREVEKAAAQQAAERQPRSQVHPARPAARSGQVKSVLRRE